MAIPLIAADEAAIIDLNAQNAWGPRPAMAPYEMASRLLMSYLSVGEHQIAGVMARALARALADERIIRWAEPSFAQLLVGYAFALSGDSLGLEAWCRRTVAVRFLGSDAELAANSKQILKVGLRTPWAQQVLRWCWRYPWLPSSANAEWRSAPRRHHL